MKINNFVFGILRNIGESLVRRNTEPQIRYKRDRHGNSYWQVYDATTNRSYAFGSEQDVRAWIENRHHSF